MAQYLLKRILYMFITLIGISIISWVIITQAPGSPVALTLDPKVSPKIIEQMKKIMTWINPSISNISYGSSA